jgi:hypothetical protein
VLSRVVEMIDDNDVEVVEQQDEGQGCTKNAHFIHPPLFCFCSDSPSVMVKVRKKPEFRLDRLLKPSSTVFLSTPIKAGSCWKGLQFCRLNVTRAEKPPSPLWAACNGLHVHGFNTCSYVRAVTMYIHLFWESISLVRIKHIFGSFKTTKGYYYRALERYNTSRP